MGQHNLWEVSLSSYLFDFVLMVVHSIYDQLHNLVHYCTLQSVKALRQIGEERENS